MHFASLPGLWFGLTLPAILLMYLLKRKYMDTVVSSHMLWNRVLRETEATRPWQRLRSNLLLILQLAVAACLVIAVMQPFVLTDGKAKSHVILILDLSASMAADNSPTSSVTRLDTAKAAMLDYVTKEAASSRVTLIAMGSVPQIVLTREQNMDRIRLAITNLMPDYGSIAYHETMSLAAALTAKENDAEIHLYTDGQWPEDVQGIPFHVPVQVKTIGDDSTENIGIVQFGVKAESTGADEASNQILGVASVKNWGKSAHQAEFSLYAGNKAVEFRTVSLQPGEQKSIQFDSLPAADYYKISMDTSDVYSLDNGSYAFAAGDLSRSALFVTEGNLFLEKALQLARVEVTKVLPSKVPPVLKTTPDMIIFDSGTGDQVLGSEWNKVLDDKPVWYLNSGLAGTPVIPSGDTYKVAIHPVTEHIGFQDTHIAAVLKTVPPTWAKTLASIEDLPLIIGGLDRGVPRLFFTFDLHASDLPLRAEFPILVQNAVDWLSSKETKGLGRETAGVKQEIAISAKTRSAHWTRIDTFGKSITPTTSDTIQAETQDGLVSAMQTTPVTPGLYTFVEVEEDGSKTISYLEAATDPLEANLSLKPTLRFENGSTTDNQTDQGSAADPSGTSDTLQPSTGQSTGLGNKTVYSLIKWLAIAALLIIFAEWGVYRRGNSL